MEEPSVLKRWLFVAPVALAALSLSAATAFADSPAGNQHGSSSATCGAASNQAALLAKLRNDQAALDAAGARLNDANTQLKENEQAVQEGHQPWRLGEVAAAQTEVTNQQARVREDQETLQQSPTQNVCNNTSANNSPTTNQPVTSPRVPSDGPGLPQTGAAS
jgi:TolA-binding protein